MDMCEILQQIGWTNGFRVPVANAENQALEAELEKLTVRKAKAKLAYDEANAKYGALDKHLKYVKQESEQNQKLLTAYVQQITAERHKFKQIKSEHDRINQEIRQIGKHVDEVDQRQEDKRNDLSKALAKIEKLKAETTWDAEALKAWEDSLKQRNNDADLLKNFSKVDECKAKELEARRQHLQLEVCEKRETVEKMVGEIRNYERMQDRTDKLFKQQEEEKKALVVQWQDAVKNLRQRDEDISKTNAGIIQMQALIVQKEEQLDEQKAFFKTEEVNNKELNMEIEELNILNSRMRGELNELVQHSLILTNDVNTVKRSLASVSSKLEKERQVFKNQTKELHQIHGKIAERSEQKEALSIQYGDIVSCTLSTADRAKHLEQMINMEQQMTKNLLLDSEKIQGILYRNQISLQELKDIAKSINAQISGIEVSNKHLQKQIKSKVNDVNLQKETVYSLEYRINEIEVKLANFDNQNKLDEETEITNAKIGELELLLSEHNEVKSFLQAQVTRLQDEMRRLSTAITTDTERIDVLKGKLQEQMLLFDGGLKQAAAAKLKTQQKQVEENVLRLRVSQLENAISKEEDSIYDLQKFKLELETSLRTRQIEIKTHHDILQAEKKNLEEARGRLRADINYRKIRIDQFQKKHHLALMALGTDDDGQPLSITHFKIKDAQERYMLQQEGDELDNKIKKAEKEIIAMENTLKVVNMTNIAYRKSLAPVDEDDEERLEMKQLEQEISNTSIVLKQKKKMLSEKRKELKRAQEDIFAIQDRQEEEWKKFEELEAMYERLKAEQSIRVEKLAKTITDVKTYKKRVSNTNLEKPERNLQIRQLQDANQEAFRQLRIMISDSEEITSTIIDMLSNYNLELPTGPKSRGSTSSSSMVPLTRSIRSIISNSSTDSCSALTPILLSFGEDKKTLGRKGK